MRTAEEIINEYWKHPTDLLKDVPKMINEARKEAIEEIAVSAKVTVDFNKKGIVMPEVDKQSILSLINKLQ